MITHERLDDGARDRAVLYALGSMPEGEAIAYEVHLSTCASCRNEVRSLRDLFAGLASLVPAVAPPPGLKERLTDRIRFEQQEGSSAASTPTPQRWKTWKPEGIPEGVTIVRANEGKWEPTGVGGVEVRRLFLDVEQDRVTMLVRMAPGASYPSHIHSAWEECLVLQGDLLVGSYRMREGDYQRAEGGSFHGISSTEGGCLLFIASSLHDELVDMDPA